MKRSLCILLLCVGPWGSAHATSSEADVFQSLHCDFEDDTAKFAVEVDMTDFDEFASEGYYVSLGNTWKSRISQKDPAKGEVFHFVLDEQKPKEALDIHVYDASDGGLKATAIMVGLKPPIDKVPGTCFFF